MRTYGILILTTLLISIYTLTNAGKFHIVDEVSLFAVTESLALRQEVDTNAIAWTQWVNSPGEVLGAFGSQDEVYSKKGPAPAFLAVGWYWFLIALHKIGFGLGILQATLLWNGMVTATAAALLWLTAERLGYAKSIGLQLALLYGLCTIAWPYANHFFGEPLSALSLLLIFYGLISWQSQGKSRWLWLAGIGAGLAIATVTAHLILIAILGLYFLYLAISSKNLHLSAWLRVLSPFIIPICISLLLLISYNYTRFGAPFETGYHFATGEGFTTPFLEGAWGLLFSPYRSLFLHTPLFILLPFTLILFIRHHRAAGFTISALTIALIILYSLWWMWWGGFAWGPRFLVPLTPFWVLTFAPLLARKSETEFFLKNSVSKTVSKILLWSLALVSFVVQLLAVSLNYVNYEIILRSIFPTDWVDPLAYGPPAQRIIDFWHSPVFGQVHLLQENLQANLDLAWVWRIEQGIHIEWSVVWMGVITLGIGLSALLIYARNLAAREPRIWLRLGWLMPLLACALMATWTQAASQNPHYGQPEQGYRAALAEICHQEGQRPEDYHSVIITVAPTVYQIAMNWLPTYCDRPPPIYGYATTSVEHVEAQGKLALLLQQYQRVWFVTGGLPPHDPNNRVERWLAENGYQAAAGWYDDYRLVQYSSGLALGGAETTEMNRLLRDPTETDSFQTTLQKVRLPVEVMAGTILPIEIFYRVNPEPRPDLRWFIQLWNETGAPVAFLDSAPLDGYAAFSTLESGQMLLEKAGLVIPPDVTPGNYRIIGGLYNPSAEGQRLQDLDGADFIKLGQIQVDSSTE